MASAEDMCDCCFPIDAPAKITRIEPKTFLANERTFLNWLSMSVTLGSVASALVAFGKTNSQQVPHRAPHAFSVHICQRSAEIGRVPVGMPVASYDRPICGPAADPAPQPFHPEGKRSAG